jgi:hypothetical protein
MDAYFERLKRFALAAENMRVRLNCLRYGPEFNIELGPQVELPSIEEYVIPQISQTPVEIRSTDKQAMDERTTRMMMEMLKELLER